MNRILYIGAGNPWQGGAGFLVRQNLFLRALAEVAELHLALFDSVAGATPDFAKSFITLPMPDRARENKFVALKEDLLSPLPRMLRGYNLLESRQRVADLNLKGFDAVFSYRIDFGHFAGVLDHPNLLLDIDDPEHIRWERRIRATSNTIDARTHRDLKKLKTFEYAAVAKAKMSFVCQENDRQGWPKAPEVVPNGVDLQAQPKRDVKSPRVIFVGNCAGGEKSPNADALAYFVREIWPLILKAIPAAEFHVIGAADDAAKAVAQNSPQTHLRGFVPNLADEYAQAAVSVAPIRFGTGTRIKILEAFAHACPVVSTIIGAEGIAAVPGREIELAGAPADFAARCIELLQNETLREKIGRGGYELAAKTYDRKVIQNSLLPRLRSALAKPTAYGSAA